MRVVIIEDEEAAYRNLTKMLGSIDGNIHIAAWLRNIKKALEWFKVNDLPDLIFLDIKLTDGISFEIFEKHEINCPVIFTTAYADYAIKAFEINGIDYLLKPFSQERLEKSINKFRQHHSKNKMVNIGEVLELLNAKQNDDIYKSRFMVKTGDKLKTVLTSEIAYFYRDDLVCIVTKENKKYPVDFSLDELEEILNPVDFFRVNRQYLVHVSSVIQAHKYFKGKLKLELSPGIEDELIISQEKASAFKSWLDGGI